MQPYRSVFREAIHERQLNRERDPVQELEQSRQIRSDQIKSDQVLSADLGIIGLPGGEFRSEWIRLSLPASGSSQWPPER